MDVQANIEPENTDFRVRHLVAAKLTQTVPKENIPLEFDKDTYETHRGVQTNLEFE